ncbi:MAG: hypothetical protein CME62_10530 [Halobacteriovoraceae bacterium]|nr:hypothetical protein [Halobacteriovoraceae bacterium]|tara:strand:- start:6813 stop:8879 length:2067 start_codon:yes stop_codon:yes gene_type:complete
MSEKKFQRFGKYLILDHLVDGGMAKICRATYLGEQANKVVAIKMVQPQYSKDPSFVQMFEDELKVSFDLVHPNIAQVYDYGMVDDQLYSAMEYVDGANLKQFLDRLREKKYVFPVEISTYIISQVCLALQYAHNYQDKLTGKSFNIIHRDISPHNIMLTYEGAVKVIDFGIAKADSNSEATQAGTIKGKLSYLAPECLDGMELDHRYDQFAVGITLWEMLCSRKLFQAKNELAVLKQIQACKVPKPSSINPNVPPELDQIVLKALAKDRTQRFDDMEKMNRALVKFLYSNYPEFNASDLGYFAKQLFQDEISADKKKFVEYGKIDLKPFIEDMKRNEHGSGASTADHSGSFISDEKRTGKIVLDLGSFDKGNTDIDVQGLDLDMSGKTAKGLTLKTKNTGTRKITKKTNVSRGQGAGATRKSANSGATPRKRSASGATRATRVRRANGSAGTRAVRVKSAGAAPRNKEQRKRAGTIIPVALVASLLMFVYTQQQMLCKFGVKSFCPANMSDVCISNPSSQQCINEKCSKDSSLAICEQATQYGEIVLENYNPSYTYLLDGTSFPVVGISMKKIPLNRKYRKLTIKKDGYRAASVDVMKLGEKEKFITVSVPNLKQLRMGTLTSGNNYTPGSWIVMDIDGEKFEKELPLNGVRVPAGTYEAIIENRLLNTERKIQVEVQENKNNKIKID